MNTFNINQHGITVKDTNGDKVMIRVASPYYNQAKEAVMRADWNTFYNYVELDNAPEDSKHGQLRGIIGLIQMITSISVADMVEDDSEEFEAEDSFVSIANTLADVKGLLADGLISPEDIITSDNLDQFAEAMPRSSASHEHDLSQWNGSPIFYPTREMAREQSDRWGMFWEYHDFGIASPAGYRYATVPRGIGPTAPKGYDWVCLPREE